MRSFLLERQWHSKVRGASFVCKCEYPWQQTFPQDSCMHVALYENTLYYVQLPTFMSTCTRNYKSTSLAPYTITTCTYKVLPKQPPPPYVVLVTSPTYHNRVPMWLDTCDDSLTYRKGTAENTAPLFPLNLNKGWKEGRERKKVSFPS